MFQVPPIEYFKIYCFSFLFTFFFFLMGYSSNQFNSACVCVRVCTCTWRIRGVVLEFQHLSQGVTHSMSHKSLCLSLSSLMYISLKDI